MARYAVRRDRCGGAGAVRDVSGSVTVKLTYPVRYPLRTVGNIKTRGFHHEDRRNIPYCARMGGSSI